MFKLLFLMFFCKREKSDTKALNDLVHKQRYHASNLIAACNQRKECKGKKFNV